MAPESRSLEKRIQRIRKIYPEIRSRFYQQCRDWHPLFRHNCLARISFAHHFIDEVNALERQGTPFESSQLVRNNIGYIEHGLEHVDAYLDDTQRPPVKTYQEAVPYAELAAWLKDELYTYLDSDHPVRFRVTEPENEQAVHVDRRALMESVAELVRNATNATRSSPRKNYPVSVHVSLIRQSGDQHLQLLVKDRGRGFQGIRPLPKNGLDQMHGGDGVRNIVIAAHRGEMIYRNRPQGGSIIGFKIPLEKRASPRE